MSRTPLNALLPNHEAVSAMQVEDLAGVVLEVLNALPEQEKSNIHLRNYSLSYVLHGYDSHVHELVKQAFFEAWAYLVREGILAEKDDPGWFFITKKGRTITSKSLLERYRQASLLPKELLHPNLVREAWPDFERGKYDAAVFQAFKAVEVAVRNAGNFALTDIGVNLMRQAFRPANPGAVPGPLTDTSVPISEQEATMSLFVGGIGRYKNPGSHRYVSLADPRDAIEAIFLANHLLRIVETRAVPNSGSTP